MYFFKRKFVRHYARELAVFSFIAFFLLGIFVGFFPVLRPDVAISREIQEAEWGMLHPLLSKVSFFGVPWVASFSIILASILFFIFSYQREAFLFSVRLLLMV
jgi:hypothetical protein